jgi:hypothetical protein
MYDPISNNWTVKAPMPTPRYLVAGAVINGQFYVVGGVNAVTGGPPLSTLEVYNPVTDSWSTTNAPMPTPRAELAAAELGGHLYVIGGFTGTGRQLESFDPTLGVWTTRLEMPTARGTLAAAVLDDRFFAIGGTPAPGQVNLPTVEQFSASDNAITLVVTSDSATTGAGLGTGSPNAATFNRLDSGDYSGLTFQPVQTGAAGSPVQPPYGAPPGTQIINIAPGDGQNGFFKATFQLPGGYGAAHLSVAANADFSGRAFLNGNPISPSMTDSANPRRITLNGQAMFSTQDPAFFREGLNELVIAQSNSDGGSSGAAFYAFVTYLVKLTPGGFEPGGGFTLRLGGQPNRQTRIQTSTNLVDWTDVLSTNAASGTVDFIDRQAGGFKARLYRAILGP